MRQTKPLAKAPAPRRKRLAKQVGSFGIVGIFNTLLDFGIFNMLQYALHFAPVPANVVSTTIAQIISFGLNRKFVFAGAKTKHGHASTVVRFIVITAIGLYVVQNLVLSFFAHVFTLPGDIAYSLAQSLGINVTADFVINNVAKLIATVFSAAWNFVLYKKIVFASAEPAPKKTKDR